MNENLKEECRAAQRARADFYRLLSSVYYRELTDADIARWASVSVDGDGLAPDLARGFREIRRCLTRPTPDIRTDLAVDYARVFLAAGIYEGRSACPYESVYTSEDGLVMQDARDEVVAAFRAEGVSVEPSVGEPEDHVSFELEFMARMAERAAAALDASDGEFGRVLRVQRDFMAAHLLNWIDTWGARIEEHAALRFYPAVFLVTRGYLIEDAALLDEMLALAEAA